ncbi:MAG: CvpA family protein [Gammaproteobacteria bacterium]|nr:CvpA family protein [Gammaproteobacteria bacterium]
MDFSWIDIAIVIILLISVVVAMFRGFVKEAISLISLVLAFWLAVNYFDQVALYLPSGIDETTLELGETQLVLNKLRAGIAFVVLVIGVLVAGALLNHLLGKITRLPVLRGIDRLFGAMFGLVRGAAIVVLVVLVAAMTSFPRTEIWEASRMMPLFETGAREVIRYIPPAYAKYFMIDAKETQVSLDVFGSS